MKIAKNRKNNFPSFPSHIDNFLSFLHSEDEGIWIIKDDTKSEADVTLLNADDWLKKKKEYIYSRAKEKILIQTSTPEFIEKIKGIREKFNIPKTGLDINSGLPEWYRSIGKTKINSLVGDLSALFEHFRIGKRWESVIKYFILFNHIEEELIPRPLLIKRKSESELEIILYKDTSLEDIIDFWPIIECNQLFNLKYVEQIVVEPGKRKWKGKKKFSSIKNFKEYKKVFDLWKSGKSYEDIAEKMGWLRSDYPKVGTYLARFKKAISENRLY